MIRKRLAYGHLLGRRLLSAVLPGIVRTGCHLQDLAELVHRHVDQPPGDVLIHAHGAGWPKMTKAFFKQDLRQGATLRETHVP